jgi:hypothetical protein
MRVAGECRGGTTVVSRSTKAVWQDGMTATGNTRPRFSADNWHGSSLWVRSIHTYVEPTILSSTFGFYLVVIKFLARF